jgi:hypothetical protein
MSFAENCICSLLKKVFPYPFRETTGRIPGYAREMHSHLFHLQKNDGIGKNRHFITSFYLIWTAAYLRPFSSNSIFYSGCGQ